jgi:hypothetical protein
MYILKNKVTGEILEFLTWEDVQTWLDAYFMIKHKKNKTATFTLETTEQFIIYFD